ncbi:MAG: glutaredoxin family protein [Dehalococcoidia bacterium]
MPVVHVPGTKSRHIMLYALSTCGWCHRAKRLLDELGVEYDYMYVDRLDGDEKKTAVRNVKMWNPACSFPTIVIDDKSCLVGYDEAQIRRELKK